MSSQILLTNLALLINDLPTDNGPLALLITMSSLPLLFALLREYYLPRCFPNLTHNSDLREKDCNYESFIQSLKDKFFKFINFSAFIQSLQLQTSKVKL